MDSVFIEVEKLKSKYISLWLDANGEINFLKKYTKTEQKAKENQIEACIDKLLVIIENAPKDALKKHQWKAALKEFIIDEAKDILSIDNREFEDIMINGFMDVAEGFIDDVREFDKNIDFEDIAQAIRNVWIMNIIQVITDKKVEITPSIFAYSMLYPYTDNYLDDPAISDDDKREFNKRLRDRLEGGKVESTNRNEDKIHSLISMIESQYDRQQYPNVFNSIIAIHNGQCKSISQHNHNKKISDIDILSISVEKGGTSVMADAFLVCGRLDKELMDMMFGFGFILQLIDDLQDIKDDIKSNSMTIFSSNLRDEKINNITNKLISFSFKAIEFEKYDKSPYILDIKKLILDNIFLLIYEAIWQNRKYYTRSYIKNIQQYSPLSFKVLKKMHSKLRKVKEFNQ